MPLQPIPMPGCAWLEVEAHFGCIAAILEPIGPSLETTFDPPFATNAYVGVHFSPELANIPQGDPSYIQKLARFSNYGDPHAPIDITPTVKIEVTQTGIQITFTGSLQSAPTVLGPWNKVVTGSPYQVPNSSTGVQFFRTKAE